MGMSTEFVPSLHWKHKCQGTAPLQCTSLASITHGWISSISYGGQFVHRRQPPGRCQFVQSRNSSSTGAGQEQDLLEERDGTRRVCLPIRSANASWSRGRTAVSGKKQSQVRGRVVTGINSCLSSSAVSPPFTSPAAALGTLGALPDSPWLSVAIAASAEKV